jgi:hypothetical protein
LPSERAPRNYRKSWSRKANKKLAWCLRTERLQMTMMTAVIGGILLPGGEGKERPARKADNLTAICEPII